MDRDYKLWELIKRVLDRLVERKGIQLYNYFGSIANRDQSPSIAYINERIKIISEQTKVQMVAEEHAQRGHIQPVMDESGSSEANVQVEDVGDEVEVDSFEMQDDYDFEF